MLSVPTVADRPHIIITPSTPAIPCFPEGQGEKMMQQQQQQAGAAVMAASEGRMVNDALYTDAVDEKLEMSSYQRASFGGNPAAHYQHQRAISDFKLDPEAQAHASDLYYGLDANAAVRQRQAAVAAAAAERTHRRAIHLLAAFLTLLLISIGLTSSCFEQSPLPAAASSYPHPHVDGRPQAGEQISHPADSRTTRLDNNNIKHKQQHAASWDDSTWHAIVEKLHLHNHDAGGAAAVVDSEQNLGLSRWLKRSFASSISTFAHFEHESEAARDVNAPTPAKSSQEKVFATSAAAVSKGPLPLMRFGLATLVDEGEAAASSLSLRKMKKRSSIPATSSAVHVVSAAEVQRQLMREAQDRLQARRQQRMAERMRQ